MQKLIGASLILLVLSVLQTNAFAETLKCDFKDHRIEGIDSIVISETNLVINDSVNIPLEQSRIRCANFGKQKRFDGEASGFQVVLKTCSSDADREGHLIDAKNSKVAEVFCEKI